MGDRIPTAGKVVTLVLVLAAFLFLYYKPGLNTEQVKPQVPQTATNQGKPFSSRVSGAKFSVTPNAPQALAAAFKTEKPIFLEFYGSG
ncbi:MAG TPA: hypothetical protein VHS59_08070 [Bacillota bacterium]|nr:hypothetical protein [Bacillota bacterium]